MVSMLTRHRLAPVLALALGLAMPTGAALANEDAVEAMQEYLMFSEYEAGIILPQQIDRDVFESVLFVDTRNDAQFEAETIPGAVHIEWREVLDRIDEIPEQQKVVVFCNTGSLSAQAAFALRVAGRTNVVVLQGGLTGWKENAAYRP